MDSKQVEERLLSWKGIRCRLTKVYNRIKRSISRRNPDWRKSNQWKRPKYGAALNHKRLDYRSWVVAKREA